MTDAPTTLDEVPWDGPDGPAGDRLQLAVPRKCRHPRDKRIHHPVGALRLATVPGGLAPVEVLQAYDSCGACGHVFDPAIQRRGRNVRKVGKGAELRDARQLGLEPRGTSRDPEDSGGALDPAVVQSKGGPGFASIAWIRELEKLERVAAGRPRILLATEKPGSTSGRAARRFVVMFEDEFIRLTGLDARRRNLEALASAVGTHGSWRDRRPMIYSGSETAILEALKALDETPAR